MIRDSFYTPKLLADKLLSFTHKKEVSSVADFCVGDGQLLRSAEARWPHVKCFGADIDADVINLAKKNHPAWVLSRMDFLNSTTRKRSKIIKSQSLYDLILLNPPFSCHGGTNHRIEYEGITLQVSTAMVFLVASLQYLKTDGVLYAILPTSTAYSQKDNKIWRLLEQKRNLAILEEPKIHYFKGCAPNIILVSLNDFAHESNYKPITRISFDFKSLTIFRGKLSMYNLKAGTRYDLVHSTNLNDNQLMNLIYKSDDISSIVSGPALLIPRVGKPKKTKMCVIEKGTYALSDCVIAIKVPSIKEAHIIYQYFLANWDSIEHMYKGTGAKYITIDKLNQFFNMDILNQENYQSLQAI